jgi:hypothetical protein
LGVSAELVAEVTAEELNAVAEELADLVVRRRQPGPGLVVYRTALALTTP